MARRRCAHLVHTKRPGGGLFTRLRRRHHMPNRILRDGILTSDRVNELDLFQENVYRRLMSVVDDFGRFDGRHEIIRAAIFPLRLDSVTNDMIEQALEACRTLGLIVRYRIDGKNFLQLSDFRQQVRVMRSKCPEPTQQAIDEWNQVRSGCAADAQQVRSRRKASAHSGAIQTKPAAVEGGLVTDAEQVPSNQETAAAAAAVSVQERKRALAEVGIGEPKRSALAKMDLKLKDIARIAREVKDKGGKTGLLVVKLEEHANAPPPPPDVTAIRVQQTREMLYGKQDHAKKK